MLSAFIEKLQLNKKERLWNVDFKDNDSLPKVKTFSQVDYIINVSLLIVLFVTVILCAFNEFKILILNNDIKSEEMFIKLNKTANDSLLAKNTQFKKDQEILERIYESFYEPRLLLNFLTEISKIKPESLELKRITIEKTENIDLKSISSFKDQSKKQNPNNKNNVPFCVVKIEGSVENNKNPLEIVESFKSKLIEIEPNIEKTAELSKMLRDQSKQDTFNYFININIYK